MKKLILILFVVIFLISVTSAEVQTLGTFKQNECANLVQTCDNCTFVNITRVLYPNSTIAVSNVEMTKDGTYYNYTFCLTNDTGKYTYTSFGDLDGENTVGNVNFDITPQGVNFDTSTGLVTVGAFFILIVATIFFLLFGIFTTNIPFKIFFVSLSTILMVGTLGFSVSVFQQMFGDLGTIVSTYGNIFVLLTILVTGGGIGLFVYAVYVAIKSFYNNARGHAEEDDLDDD